jgi:hypothetical protein
LPCINYERPDISCAEFTQLVRLYPKLHSFHRNTVLERQMAFPQSQRLVYNNILVWEVQILEFFVLNKWTNVEKFGRILIFTCCGIINEMNKSDNEFHSFHA